MTLHVLPSGYVFNEDDVSDITFVTIDTNRDEMLKAAENGQPIPLPEYETVQAVAHLRSQKYAKHFLGNDLKALLAWRSSLNQLTVPSSTPDEYAMRHLRTWTPGMDFP